MKLKIQLMDTCSITKTNTIHQKKISKKYLYKKCKTCKTLPRTNNISFHSLIDENNGIVYCLKQLAAALCAPATPMLAWREGVVCHAIAI